METIEKNGKTYVLVTAEAWEKLVSGDAGWPELPPADKSGNRDALAYARVSIARSIIRDRTVLGWTQAELARQSGVRVDILNRIERAKHTADESTIKRLDKAMRTAGKKATRQKTVKV
jgi:ribosome-binding protein aMBF1 (putative translation factor)